MAGMVGRNRKKKQGRTCFIISTFISSRHGRNSVAPASLSRRDRAVFLSTWHCIGSERADRNRQAGRKGEHGREMGEHLAPSHQPMNASPLTVCLPSSWWRHVCSLSQSSPELGGQGLLTSCHHLLCRQGHGEVSSPAPS